jgi:multidrug efflux pump subunit AcrA (membrane-fusion protein)
MWARRICGQVENAAWKCASSLLLISAPILFSACNSARGDQAAQEAPPPAKVVVTDDASLFTVDHPEQFPLATADARSASSELVVTGTVTPDVARNVPVVSLASGRVMDIKARLGDTVKKGQLLLTVRSDDVASGFSDYRKAVADEVLARAQLERSNVLPRTKGASCGPCPAASYVVRGLLAKASKPYGHADGRERLTAAVS